MKHFLIKYSLKSGTEDQRKQEMVAFIAAMEKDPAVAGKIAYRCAKVRGTSDYFHVVAAEDDAVAALQSQDYFKRYTDQTKIAAGGGVEVIPLEVLAETK